MTHRVVGVASVVALAFALVSAKPAGQVARGSSSLAQSEWERAEAAYKERNYQAASEAYRNVIELGAIRTRTD